MPHSNQTSYAQAFVNSVERSRRSAELVLNSLRQQAQQTRFKLDQRILNMYTSATKTAMKLKLTPQAGTIIKSSSVTHRAFRNKGVRRATKPRGLKAYINPALTNLFSAGRYVRMHKFKFLAAVTLIGSSGTLRRIQA